jgi:hypothetical protein
MRNLICWCPQTQRPIDLRLYTDYATLARIWSSSVRFHCLHCGADHETKVGAACLQTTLARTASSETHEASELEENTEVHRQSTERPASLGAELQPPDPNVGPTAVRSPAAMPREKLFQRLWARMMIGVHVCARSGLDRLLGAFVDCVCEVCVSKTVRPPREPFDRDRRFAAPSVKGSRAPFYGRINAAKRRHGLCGYPVIHPAGQNRNGRVSHLAVVYVT